MKKNKIWEIIKSVGLFILPILVKKQKFIKTDQDRKNVDDAADILKTL